MYKRLFIAIRINPTEEMLRRIYYLKKNLEHEKINWVPEDHMHITLKFLGNTRVDKIHLVNQAIQNIVSKRVGFNFEIGGVGMFGSSYHPKVLWLNINQKKEIEKLQSEIIKGLNTIGYEEERQNFVPHISLARIKKLNDRIYFQSLINKIPDDIVQIQSVKEILLIESILTTKGAVYKIEEKFPYQKM